MDDQPAILKAIGSQLEKWGYQVSPVQGGVAGTVHFSSRLFDMVVTDLQMPDMNGFEVLREIKKISPQTPVIILASPNAILGGMKTIREGAFDYIQKNELHIIRQLVLGDTSSKRTPDPLRAAVGRALRHVRLLAMNRRLVQELNGRNEELRHERQLLAENIEQLQRTQAELVAMEKAASLGVLTAGVGNEINNPLACVQVNVKMLAEWALSASEVDGVADLLMTDEIPEIIAESQEAVQRITQIVKQLRQFSASSKAEESGVVRHSASEIDNLLEELVAPLRVDDPVGSPSRNFHINVNVDVDVDVDFDPALLRQLLRLLIDNAVEAYQDTGTEGLGPQRQIIVRIHVEDARMHQENHDPGDVIRIHVSDQGCGIEEDILGKVFDPFFSNKHSSGLGLAIAHSLATRMGGRLTLDSRAGEGTTVTLELPRAREANAAGSGSRAA